MKLDYIDNVNEYGDNIVRLYEFDKLQAIKFRKMLHQTIIKKKTQLDLSTVSFIELRNCNLIIRIADIDDGISTNNKIEFYCDMTLEGYEKLLALIEPYCTKEIKGYQWLYDIDSQTDFLFSPSGTW